MTKTYPEGTRWRVANKTTGDVGLAIASYEYAMGVLWQARHDAKVAGNLFTYRLVRIPPPRPKRSVEDRIAEAVRERTAPILHIVEGQREHLRRSIRQRTTEEHLDAIITLLRDLRDGKVTT